MSKAPQLAPEMMGDRELWRFAIKQLHRIENWNDQGEHRGAIAAMITQELAALYELRARTLERPALFEVEGAYSAE
jgi:hypothetical protein